MEGWSLVVALDLVGQRELGSVLSKGRNCLPYSTRGIVKGLWILEENRNGGSQLPLLRAPPPDVTGTRPSMDSISSLQMGKWRLRNVKPLSQGHRADSELGPLSACHLGHATLSKVDSEGRIQTEIVG